MALSCLTQFAGYDVGTSKSIVAVASQPSASSAKIIRNNLENDNTPTVVAATSSQLLQGELAVDQIRINPKNAVVGLPGVVGVTRSEYLATGAAPAFELIDGPKGKLRVSVTATAHGVWWCCGGAVFREAVGKGFQSVWEQAVALHRC